MDSKKSGSKDILTLILFFIYPIGALPMIIQGLLNKRIVSFYLIALFVAMLGFILIPLDVDDLTRHYSTFINLQEFNYADLEIFLFEKTDYLFNIFLYVLGQLGFSKQFIPFFSFLLGYYLSFSILLDWFKSRGNLQISKFYVLFLILAFCIIDFRSFSLNIRNFIALSFLMKGAYLLFIKNKKIGWIFILLAALTHFMVLLIIPLFIVNNFLIVKKSILPRVLFLVSFIFYLLPSNSVTDAVNSYSLKKESFKNKQEDYTSKQFTLDLVQQRSFEGNVMNFIGRIPIFLSFIYLILIKRKSKLRNMVYFAASLTNFFFATPVFFERYSLAVNFLFWILLMYEYLNEETLPPPKLFLYFFVFFIALAYSADIYATRRQIVKSHYKMFYQTSLSVFFNSVNEEDYIEYEK